MEVSNSVQPKCRKRKRSRRITGMRHYKGNHDNWQKNRRKRARLAGKEYTSTTGKTMPEKMSKTCACNHGRQHVFKCDLFSDDCRKDILSKYYGTANFCRQRDFILNHTSSRVIASSKRKHKALQYSLPLAGAKMRVCKKMFLSTLDISEKLVTYTLDNCERDGGSRAFSKTDQRGKYTPANKTPVQLLEAVRKHIKSFPTMEPHYVRRLFLGADLNIKKMYELYVEQCKVTGLPSVKEGVYRRVFCDEFNMSFHVPKKDACAKCEQYENADDKRPLEEEHLLHIARKKQAQDEKSADKLRATENSEWHALTVDLQSVLSTPCGHVSSLYYSRKLSVYNFTLYNQVNGDGFCICWNETQAQRGANEIGSAIHLYLKEFLPLDVRHVVLTSDSTVSQNRNQFLTVYYFWLYKPCIMLKQLNKSFSKLGTPTWK